MVKVFHIVTSFDLGGAEKVAFNLVKSSTVDFEYHLVEVVHSDSTFSKQLIADLKSNHIHLHCSPLKSKKLGILLFGVWFVWIYLSKKPNIIHAHTEIPDLALWIFRKIVWLFCWIRPKYIRTIHNTQLWSSWDTIGRIVESYYMKHHSNCAISISTKKSYEYKYKDKNIPIIYNGLEEVEQKPFPGVVKGKINILFAGRLEFQKGVDELIAVVKALKNDNRYYFHIVGSGTMREKVKRELGPMEMVTIYDKIYNLSQYLSSFDYLFMPSNFEGLALLSIEAAFAKTPAIINSCPGLKDTLPSDWPLLVNGNSVKQYLYIFKNILPDIDQNQLGMKAYIFAKEKFAVRKMQEAYESKYRKITYSSNLWK